MQETKVKENVCTETKVTFYNLQKVTSPFEAGIKDPVYSAKTQDLNGHPLLCVLLADDLSRG